MGQFPVSQVSVEDAHRWRDHVAGSERRWLTQLAHWVSDSDGPVDDLDFTIESLVPLWRWYVQWYRDGLPGAERGMRDELVTAFGGGEPQVEWQWEEQRRSATGNALSHYVAVVLRRLDPLAAYRVLPPSDDPDDAPGVNQTCFVVFGTWMGVPVVTSGVATWIDRPPFSSSDPAYIRDRLLQWLPQVATARPLELAPYDVRALSTEPVPPTVIPRFEPQPPPPRAAARAKKRADPFSLILVHRSAKDDSEEQLRGAPAIPAGPLLAMLDRIGAGDDAEPVTLDLLLDSQQTSAFDGGMNIETIVVDGTVRAVLFDAMDIETTDRSRFTRALKALRTAADGKLIRDA